MNKLRLIILLSGITIAIYSQILPTKQEVLGKMQLANNYFLTKWPDPTKVIVTNKSRPSNLWTRGTYYEGLMQFYYLTQDAALYKYALDWGTFHKWQPTYTGFTPTRIADNQCCGQTYLELYLIDPKPEKIATMQASIDEMLNSTKVNDWWWIDALHMAMPVFTKFGNIKNDNRYYEKMYDLYNYTKRQIKGVGLYNTADSLWYRDSVYLPPKKSPNNLPVYWSRGNGWVFAALARTLDVLPENAPHRDDYVTTFKEMAAKLIKIQRGDGFWNCNLGDPNDYGGKETSGTVFFTFGLAWGINNQLLDSATYFAHVVTGWNGLVNYALHADGKLGFVQSAGSKPADGQPLSYDKLPDFEDFALGGFLLAGSEVYQLAKTAANSTGIEARADKKPNFSVYPNPFGSFLNIHFGTTNETTEVAIFNTSMQRVFHRVVEPQVTKTITWQIEQGNKSASMSEGIYFVSVKNGNNISFKKIIHQKSYD